MSNTEAYVADKGREGQNPRQIQKGQRRRAVASLHAQGLSHRKIAERLNIGKSTVARDLKYIKSSEHQVRAQEAAQEIIEAETVEEKDFSMARFRDNERGQVVELIAQKNTYEQVANKLGISISTVLRHVNAYLEEYGDWGGRTMQEWRNEHLIGLYNIMNSALEDMNIEPEPDIDEFGDQVGWKINPQQAAKVRSDARKDWMNAQTQQAKLLQLLVKKTEHTHEEKVVVMTLRDVDMNAFPPQDVPRLIEG